MLAFFQRLFSATKDVALLRMLASSADCRIRSLHANSLTHCSQPLVVERLHVYAVFVLAAFNDERSGDQREEKADALLRANAAIVVMQGGATARTARPKRCTAITTRRFSNKTRTIIFISVKSSISHTIVHWIVYQVETNQLVRRFVLVEVTFPEHGSRLFYLYSNIF